MARELKEGASNEWDHIIWAQPGRRTPEQWREAYNFKRSGSVIYFRTENFVGGRFSQKRDSKDVYIMEDCIDPRARRVLEYIVPIVYSERPTRCTTSLVVTILGSYFTERKVALEKVIQ